MKAPAISVLMPVYNAELYVAEAVESILAQTFTDFELITIDDGSTDRSSRILEGYAGLDSRIRLVSRPNTGIVGALNEGASMARGEIIARMDADDVSMPERFAKQFEYLLAHPDCHAAGSRVLLIDPEGAPICEINEERSHEEIDRAHMSRRTGAITHPAVMMRREALHAVGGYRQECLWAEDFDLLLRLAEIGRLANLPEMLLKYREHFLRVSFCRHAEQQKSVTRALQDACARRGVPLTETHLRARSAPHPSVWDEHRAWARWALGAGNFATARKHAFAAFRRVPFSLRSCKVMAHALLGG